MKRFFSYVLVWVLVVCNTAVAQVKPAPLIFAHNDYAQPKPFMAAYGQKVAFIEADVFVKEGDLWVAHDEKDLVASHTLGSLYLEPLQKKIKKYRGYPYRDLHSSLTIMIDFKTGWEKTLPVLVTLLQRYPDLLEARQLKFCISGSMPPPEEWDQIPRFIHFDGRPDRKYSTLQLTRIPLVSDSFSKYARWSGDGELSSQDAQNLQAVIKKVHTWNKPIRLWAIPDQPHSWNTMHTLGIDIINTDQVRAVRRFFKQK